MELGKMKKTKHSRVEARAKRAGGTLRAIAGITAALIISGAHTAAAQDTASPFAGTYIGVHVGHAGADANFTGAPYIANLPNEDVAVSGRNDNFDLDGGLIGVHGGYNAVRRGKFLFGFEGDWSHLDNKDTVTGGETVIISGEDFVFDHVSTLDLNWQATLRARLGYIAGRTLFFGTIGVALLDLDWSETATAFDDDAGETYVQNHRGSDTLTGLALGGGIEFAVRENVFIGADYLYENFGSSGGLPFGHSTPPQIGKVDDLDVHKVRLRLSIKLGGGE